LDLPVVVVLMLFGETALLAAYISAWVAARTHRGRKHHYIMLSAFALDLLVFKPLMLARASSIYGSYPWPGSNIVYHFYLDIAVVVLGILNIYFGFRFRVKKDGKMFMPPRGRVHRITGSAFLVVWVITFLLGIELFAWAHIP
jgi:uncharacterized membrane protein YozB (DUF420 family)